MMGRRVSFGHRGPKILLTVPVHSDLSQEVSRYLADVAIYEERAGRLQGHITHPVFTPLENGQHHICVDIIDRDYDYWASIDADNPPRRNILDLVFLDLDIVGCPTPVWHWVGNGDRPYYWNAYAWDESEQAFREWPIKSGLQKVDAIGGGAFVIARRVVEHHGLRQGAFTRLLDDRGRVDMGNDLSFCRRATGLGFDIYAHYDYPCGHLVRLDLLHIIEAFQDIRYD